MQELKQLLHQRQECSVREWTEGFYSLVEEDGVKLRTVELTVGEINVADLLMEQGLAKREHIPEEMNQGQSAQEKRDDQVVCEVEDSVDEEEAAFGEVNVDGT